MNITVTRKKSKAETRNQSRSVKRVAARNEPLVFVGIDTEGSGKGTKHRPVLVSCGTAYLSDINGLDWERVFEFLYSQFQLGGFVYGGFYLSYDFTQWLRSLPENRARMLLTPEGRAIRKRKLIDGAPPFPVYVGKWEVDILATKRLKIRPAGESRWMYICDSGPFFQCSFLKAIDPEKWTEPIVTQAEYDRIKEGKDYRSEAELDDMMVEYQQLEVEVWSRLMAALETGLRHIGIHLAPKQWFGPGQVAQEWLKKTTVPRVKELKELVSPLFLEAARATYFGGWFEIFMHGHIPGITHEYDINSAYPYIISRLPCVRHGRESYGDGKPKVPEGALCIVRGVAYTIPPNDDGPDDGYYRDRPIGAMLHRDPHGRIYRPRITEGYWWWHELEAAIRAGVVSHVRYDMWWIFEPTCDCPPPLADIEKLYYERLSVGKNTMLGKAIRLLINSVYGKFAQSIGDPMFGNPIYASLITAGCRIMILDAIASHPKGVMNVGMVATDGVYFLDPHPGLSLSSNLGDWEHKEHHNLSLFKPGMYWDDESRQRIADGKAPEFKSRGINPKDFAPVVAEVDRIFSTWPRNKKRAPDNPHMWDRKSSRWPTVKFRAGFSMVSMTQAIQPGWDWSRAGETSEDVILQQNAWPGEKRDQPLFYDAEKDIFRTLPRDSMFILETGRWGISAEYEKRFGMEDPWSDIALEMKGITPDGPVADMIGDALFGSR